jgi:hypothetical protein
LKFLKTRLAVILITAILTIVLVGGGMILAGTISKPLTGTVTVVAANPVLNVYADAACTQPLSSFDLGSVIQNETSSSFTFYIKNEGNKPVGSITVTSDFGSPNGTFLVVAKPTSLDKNVSGQIVIRASIAETCPPGALTINVTVGCVY